MKRLIQKIKSLFIKNKGQKLDCVLKNHNKLQEADIFFNYKNLKIKDNDQNMFDLDLLIMLSQNGIESEMLKKY